MNFTKPRRVRILYSDFEFKIKFLITTICKNHSLIKIKSFHCHYELFESYFRNSLNEALKKNYQNHNKKVLINL
ncbi:hypothetical protein BpHYR1_026288 [Brachionus plicatilis]|uniref:Uncharacterized protein n=1 Tax=Brachionus plicatilis TaxID=10195 RepID=A0A3M7QAE3_BRAPC|nr:hypothetical protein BpHYR1_026288 [Brachionus plicatilis]